MKTRTARRRFKLGKTAEAYIFLIPFMIGAVVFFLVPLFISFKLSFGELTGASTFDLQWRSWPQFFDHYSRALFVDTSFVPILLKEVQQMLLRAPLIIAFSAGLLPPLSAGYRQRTAADAQRRGGFSGALDGVGHHHSALHPQLSGIRCHRRGQHLFQCDCAGAVELQRADPAVHVRREGDPAAAV